MISSGSCRCFYSHRTFSRRKKVNRRIIVKREKKRQTAEFDQLWTKSPCIIRGLLFASNLNRNQTTAAYSFFFVMFTVLSCKTRQTTLFSIITDGIFSAFIERSSHHSKLDLNRSRWKMYNSNNENKKKTDRSKAQCSNVVMLSIWPLFIACFGAAEYKLDQRKCFYLGFYYIRLVVEVGINNNKKYVMYVLIWSSIYIFDWSKWV